MDTITAVMLRGVKFAWTASGPSQGMVTIEHPYPVHDALFATWEGMLQFCGSVPVSTSNPLAIGSEHALHAQPERV